MRISRLWMPRACQYRSWEPETPPEIGCTRAAPRNTPAARTSHSAMASVGFGTVAPAVASPARSHLGRRAARPSSAHVPAATKSVVAAAKAEEKKGLFDLIFGPMFKEEQLLETDPILNKVEGKGPAPKAAGAAAKKADDGGFSFDGLFSKKG